MVGGDIRTSRKWFDAIMDEEPYLPGFDVPQPIDLTVDARNQRRRDIDARAPYKKGSDLRPDIALIILVDEKTASSAEMFAGSLQAYERALIVGRRTTGKAIGQQCQRVKKRRGNHSIRR